MGSGIAQWLSSRGVSVILRDVGTEELTPWSRQHRENLRRRGQTRNHDGRESEGRTRPHRCLQRADRNARCSDRDRSGLGEIGNQKTNLPRSRQKAPQAAILATNTSALPISDLAAETKTPERVIGLHFFNPVSRMKLVEVVIGTETSDDYHCRARSFCAPDRQAASDCAGQSRVPREPRPLSLFA